MSSHPLEKILHPRSIAVVGASENPRWGGFVTPLLELGFEGTIYPVNPRYQTIQGLKAYPSIKDIPGPVDYVISSVPAAQVLKVIDDCAHKGVRVVHFFTARFSETGRREAAELERQLLQRAKEAGIRIIGPNCMGVYYPRLGITFSESFPRENGAAGLASQSGNVSGEIILAATHRGVYFSKAISYGNAIDLNESDYLDYFAQDRETKLIMMYVEGVKDGQRFFSSLRRAAAVKPVIIIKGGRGESGARATASHTASLAGSAEIWKAAVNQAGGIVVNDLDELIDVATALYYLPPFEGRRVGVAGGAGGASVLAADQCEEAGLDVVPLPASIRETLKSQGNAIWDWIGNPADMSITTDESFTVSTMLKMMADSNNYDLLIAMMHSPHRRWQSKITVEKFLESYVMKDGSHLPLLTVITDRNLPNVDDDKWSKKLMGEVKTKLIASGIPFYPSIGRAARAASKLTDYYRTRLKAYPD